MDSLLQDVRYAVRQLWADKAFLLTAGLTLAVCIGANATIFSVVNSVILQPLPMPEPDRVVRLWNAYPAAAGGDRRGANGVPDYYDRRAMKEVFTELGNYGFQGRSIQIDGQAERITTLGVTPSVFTVVGARAEIGRLFTEEESLVGNERVAVLSHDLWQRLSGGDPGLVGSDLMLDGSSFEIIGVLPAGYRFLGQEFELVTPFAYTDEERQQFHSNNYQQLARLADGVSIEQARAQIDALNERNMDLLPELKPLLEAAGFHTVVVFLQEDLVSDVKDMLTMLWGGVAFVLLIGVVNVANLALVRATARTRELATRFALGAPRRRVVRQLLTENLLLTMVAGALGLLLGWLGLRALTLFNVEALPRAAEIRMDLLAVGFTLALAALVGIAVALIPVASVARLTLSTVFREEGRSGTASRATRLLRKGLVSAQVAFALILLLGAGLLLSSFRQVMAIDVGFDPAGTITGRVYAPDTRYEGIGEIAQFTDAVLERARALPGIEVAAVGSTVPFTGSMSSSVIFAEGYLMQEGESVLSPANTAVSSGYFDALGIPIVQGRAFDDRDTADGERVIIIDQILAARYFPDGDAVGRRMFFPAGADFVNDPEQRTYLRIVGVAASIKMAGMTEAFNAVGGYYLPMTQSQYPRRGLVVVARTAADPAGLVPGLREAVAEVDPTMPFYDVSTMESRIRDSLADRRAPMLLTGVFAAVALFLAAVGIYGALGYLVAMRQREIGIRVALGSGVRRVFRMVVREGAVIVGAGLAAGLAGAFALGRMIESQLYGVAVTDPMVIAAVVAILGAVGLIACLVPARRATRIDPVVALQD
jgi:predicted permease